MREKKYKVGEETGTLFYFSNKYGISISVLRYKIAQGYSLNQIINPIKRATFRPALIEGPPLREIQRKNAKKKIVWIQTGSRSGFYWWADDEPEVDE